MKVGWIGLGAMGAPMAARLRSAGHELRGFDVNAEAARRAIGELATPSIAATVEGADAVCLMVATADQAAVALFGDRDDDGAAARLSPGAVVIVFATVGPDPLPEWRRRLAEHGVDLVDAPVSGGVARAASGELLVMRAGSERALAAAAPVIDALAAAQPIAGADPGDGQRVKLVNQLLCGVHIAAAGEALALARAMGLDVAAVWETLRHGAANSFMLDDRGARMLEADPPVRSAVDLFVKDLGLVAEAGRSAGASLSVASAAEAMFRGAHDAGLGRADDSSVFRYLVDERRG